MRIFRNMVKGKERKGRRCPTEPQTKNGNGRPEFCPLKEVTTKQPNRRKGWVITVLHLHKSMDDIYVKPEAVDAIIPVRDDYGNFLYTLVIIKGKEYKTDNNPLSLIHSEMKDDS